MWGGEGGEWQIEKRGRGVADREEREGSGRWGGEGGKWLTGHARAGGEGVD